MRAADEQALRIMDAQWSKTAAAKDLDGTVAFYSEDAQLLPPDAPLAAGSVSIRAFWGAFLPTVDTISWEVKTVEVSPSGEMGYLTGAWTTTAKSPTGRIQSDHGKLLEVWKRERNGAWKCVADMYNSDAPSSLATK